MSSRKTGQKSRAKELAGLKVASELMLRRRIRELLALPMAKRDVGHLVD
jgi:hypothetical protein